MLITCYQTLTIITIDRKKNEDEYKMISNLIKLLIKSNFSDDITCFSDNNFHFKNRDIYNRLINEINNKIKVSPIKTITY
jgi:hypothetical protein